ncbi:hypothetical protein H8S90_17595 [Olivibacter sp. SDN3]|uniref:DUF6580 family putative transport protein n=1 Tax=Olivibacter sp. SDN3 TaxID=2764720 RepID=UPI0016515FAB|nr:DUF6580 family putative transport protein [Olivibacter sp. SDN3]QNL48587.1 hypothetical protein H8S90_17595 [Olivibacter sp. SDN3]
MTSTNNYTNKVNTRNLILILIIITVALLRIFNVGKFGDWANFTPVGAIALFAGTYFKDRWAAYSTPLLVLFLSDIIVNYGYFGKVILFYDGIFWVYFAFALMVLIGSFIKRVSVLSVIAAALSSVIIHWLLTNFGVWLGGKLYPRNLQGLIDCYILAIPFEKNLLLGSLAYGGILYGGFEWAKRHFPNLKWSGELSS